ncbi:Kelch repeat-containing protein [Spirosoma pollinicola]|uniref:Galactose oxidase n=1 Tax=Spirosoma pollinicola TaxID=2057025 RepID=A0A2K8Z8A8_9BACT|nr:kelch repeat-containing protein [Spirosoma pollinicola]AUD06113.1 hypothetical protein CWM47_32280 [Spirosoma pollinicola]
MTFKFTSFIGLLLLVFTPVIPAQGQLVGHWKPIETKTKLAARSECGLATVNGKLYLLGGDGPLAGVEEFDPTTLSWTPKASPSLAFHHVQPVSENGKIYLLGAFAKGNFPTQLPMTNVYSYDPKTDRWEKGAEIPVDRRRASGGSAAYKGKLYLVNGIQYGHSSGTTNQFDEYDPVTRQWKQLPDAPHIRDHSMAAVAGDKLYAVGGRNTSYHEPDNFMAFMSKTVLEVDCYDFKTGRWSTLAAKLPMGSGGGNLVNLDGKLVYMGGERATATSPNGAQKETYYLDLANPTQWIQAGDLTKARNGVGATVFNHQIYVAGGAGGGPGGPPPNGAQPGPPGPPPGSNGRPPGPPPGNRPPGEGGDISLEVFSFDVP